MLGRKDNKNIYPRFLPLCLYQSLVCLWIGFSLLGGTATAASDFSEDSEWIMRLRTVAGQELEPELLVHQWQSQWWLPVQGMLEAMGFSLQRAPSQLKGTFFDAREPFVLSLDSCEWREKDKASPLGCEQLIEYEDDIWLPFSVLATHLPLKLDIDSQTAEIVVNSPQVLPKVQQLALLNRKKPVAGGIRQQGYGFPLHRPAKQKLQGFYWDNEFSYEHQNLQGESDSGLLYEGGISARFSDATLYVNHSESSSDKNTRLRLESLNPADDDNAPSYRQWAIGDIVTRRAEAITDLSSGEGVMLSNYPLSALSDYGTERFEGNVQKGWEVELYLNGRYIATDSDTEDGIYTFEDVPVQYGSNRYKLMFFGPRGEREEQIREVSLASQFVKKGAFWYQVSSLDNDRGVEENSLQFDVGAFKNTYVRAALNKRTQNNERTLYGLLGLGLSRGVWSGAYSYFWSSLGGVGQKLDLKVPSPIGRVHFTHHQYDGFVGARLNRAGSLESESTINYYTRYFSRINARYKYQREVNVSGSVHEDLQQRLSLSWRRAHMIWDAHLLGANRHTLSLQNIDYTHRFNAQVNFQNDDLQSHGLSYSFRESQYTYARMGFQKPVDGETSYHFELSRNTRYGNFGVQANYSDDDNYTLQLKYFLSVSRNPHNNRLVAFENSHQDSVHASVLVFDDQNQNTAYDLGEPPIPNVDVAWKQRGKNQTTDDDGMAQVQQLPTRVFSDLAIDIETLPDPSYRLALPGLRVYGVAGAPLQVFMPVVRDYEVDGKVYLGAIPAAGVILQLLDFDGTEVAQTTTDTEGYFYFDELPFGHYSLLANQTYLIENNLMQVPQSLNFKTQNQEALYDLKISLEPIEQTVNKQ